MKRLIVFLGISLFLCLDWKIMTGGFRLDKIYASYEFCPRRLQYSHEIPSNFLQRKFHYLGKGSQVYVFENVDQRKVLKFARLSRYRLHFWQKMLENFFLTKKYVVRRQAYYHKMSTMAMKSYALAYNTLRDITALEYVSLEIQPNNPLFITLEDAIHREFFVDIHRTIFVIQQKAIPLDQALIRIKKTKNFQQLDTLFQSYFDTILIMLRKKITNKDYNCVNNLGILHDQVIFTDVGSFVYDPNLDSRKAVEQFTHYFYKWARLHFKDAIPYFERAKASALKNIAYL